jgi:hypothetical protein
MMLYCKRFCRAIFFSVIVVISGATAARAEILLVSYQASDLIEAYSTNANDLGAFANIPSGTSTGLNGPTGMAADAFGNIYVANSFDGTIEKYSPTGADLGVFANSEQFNDYPYPMSFGNNGNLYVADFQASLIEFYSASGASLGSFPSVQPYSPDSPSGIAIDAGGDVYVANSLSPYVWKYSSLGTNLGQFIYTGLNDPWAIAFDPEGNLYVSYPSLNTVEKYSSNGADLGTFASNLNSPRALRFDSAGNLFVLNIGDSTLAEFSSAGALLQTITLAAGSYPRGILFVPGPIGPTVATQPAADLAAKGAELNATVNQGDVSTAVYFEWGLTISYGSFTATNIVAPGGSTVTVSDFISKLLPKTTYHFQAIGSNTFGVFNGGDLTFTTLPLLPTVTSGTPSAVSTNSAQLNGVVNPNGLAAGAWFQWGPTTNYGNATPVTAMGSGTQGVGVNATISGLQAGSPYYYLLTATNVFGPASGANINFATADTPRLISGVAASVSGQFTIQFQGGLAESYTVLGSTNPSLSLSNWTVLGVAAPVSGNTFQFTDTQATNLPSRFYILRSP